jgi:hypothetical protein
MPAKCRRPVPMAALGLAVIAAAAGCSSSGGSTPPRSSSTGSTPGGSTTSSGATAQAATTTVPAFNLPSQAALESALLDLGGAGEPFTETQSLNPTSEQQSTAGCSGLDNDLFNGSGTGVAQAQAGFDGGDSGPFLTESVVSEPEAQFATDVTRTIGGLSSCRSVTITRGASAQTLTLTPDTTFPPGATAARFTTTISGVPVAGDLAAERVGDAFLIVLVADVPGSTTVDAQTVFTKALQKAQSVLGS